MNAWIANAYIAATPEPVMGSGVGWCEKHVRLPRSSRSEKFDGAITPWTREPLERVTTGGARSVTFVKPVQAGGSVAGEAAICYWIVNENGGDIQYNWEDEIKAGERWDKRFERILEASAAVMENAPSKEKHVGKWKRGQIIFPNANLTMQGVWTETNLDSDTVRFQVNEEIHSWKPGRLAKAYNRITAVWNATVFNISNAGDRGDQLHQRFLSGTQQHWEVLCPSCGKHHEMRSAWDDKHPELGGLRYDSDGARLENGQYDYQKIEQTVRYQMPCGGEIKDEPMLRRMMSLSGRYGEPKNPGALKNYYSYTLEAVAVDYIPWIVLIQEKHEALAALRGGDPDPWKRYLTERECRFWSNEERPVINRIVVNSLIRKNRDGMKDRLVRFAALDKQRGRISLGQFPHWWAVIRDVDKRGNSLLVWEGKCETDEDMAATLKDHGVRPLCVVADSGDGTMDVYQFCLRHGYNAIKGRPDPTFAHKDGARRIYSQERSLHAMINAPPSHARRADEPQFWLYSKPGIRERLHWMRGAADIKWDVPGDVSEDYRNQMESEELQERRMPKTQEIVREWVQIKRHNHLFVCECYIAMQMEMVGLVGLIDAAPAEAGE